MGSSPNKDLFFFFLSFAVKCCIRSILHILFANDRGLSSFSLEVGCNVPLRLALCITLEVSSLYLPWNAISPLGRCVSRDDHSAASPYDDDDPPPYGAKLQPRVRGWLLASVDGTRVGLVPANYIKVLGARPPSATGPSKEEKASTTAEAASTAP